MSFQIRVLDLVCSHSLRIVEETGARMFGLEEREVMERRRYVEFVRKEIDVRTFTRSDIVIVNISLIIAPLQG